MYAAAECIVRGHNAKEGTLRQNELIMLVLAKRTGLIWGFRNLFQKFKILFFRKKNVFYCRFLGFSNSLLVAWSFLHHHLNETLAPGLKSNYQITFFYKKNIHFDQPFLR